MADYTLGRIHFAPQKPDYYDSNDHCKPVDIAAARNTNGHDYRRDDGPDLKYGPVFTIPGQSATGQPEAANSDRVELEHGYYIEGGVLKHDEIGISFTPVPDPYTTLRAILDAAFNHAATGKGKERHGSSGGRDLPFDEQPMLTITRLVGPGFPLGQAIKKSQEAAGMIERGQYDAAVAECLGAINYLAGCVAWVRERKVAA